MVTGTKKWTASLSTIVDVGDEVKAAVATLNAALAKAHDLNIKVVIVKKPQSYDIAPQAPQFRINRLDFSL